MQMKFREIHLVVIQIGRQRPYPARTVPSVVFTILLFRVSTYVCMYSQWVAMI